MASYYLYRNSENHGPYPEAQLRSMIEYGDVKGDELIFEVNGTEWIPASNIAHTSTEISVTPPTPRATVHSTSLRQNSQTQPLKCPGTVTFVGWYHIVSGIFIGLLGLLCMFIPSSAIENDPDISSSAFLAVKIIFAFVCFGMAALYIIHGKKLLEGKKWAWVVALILSILGILNINPLSIATLICLLRTSSQRWCSQ